MKREIITLKGRKVSGCCPGHDKYPNDVYKTRLSRKRRRELIKVEHQHVRQMVKRNITKELGDL